MARVTERARSKAAFVQASGWAGAHIAFLAGDASNRRYERLTHPDGRIAVLMDAPPDRGEDVRPFIAMAEYLCARGLSAPRILARDAAQGWLLLEDLGDSVFARVLARGTANEAELYGAAMDVLVHLHDGPQPDLPRYDAAIMSDLACLAYDWYRPAGRDKETDRSRRSAFRAAIHDLLAPLESARQVVILRDYHAENLIWLPDRSGVARVGLLDFQDAMLGHPAYDVVSVLQDARRDVPPALEERMRARFIDGSGADAETFTQAYTLLGVQRNLRIVGVFARLSLRDGKPHYVDLIPRVWGLLQRNLAQPQLQDLARLIGQDLPPPDPSHLERLKATCAKTPAP